LLSINWEVLTRDLRATRHVSAADRSFGLARPPAATCRRVSHRLQPSLTYRNKFSLILTQWWDVVITINFNPPSGGGTSAVARTASTPPPAACVATSNSDFGPRSVCDENCLMGRADALWITLSLPRATYRPVEFTLSIATCYIQCVVGLHDGWIRHELKVEITHDVVEL
jgi:hypothetical protein